MSSALKGNPSSVAYWNDRVKKAANKQDMIFLDPRRERYWDRVRQQLMLWKDKSVLDVCCGYGQFSDIFTNYQGVDFSEEMIALAPKDKDFICADVKTFVPKKCDIIFEVNSLRSLEMTPDDFYSLFKEYATEAVGCLEADRFTIYEHYT